MGICSPLTGGCHGKVLWCGYWHTACRDLERLRRRTADACLLLVTAAEISDAVGMPAGPSQESDMVIPEGPSKGETMSMCMWPIGE